MSNIAIILANLGSPDEPTTKAVSRYLNQFLSDRRVIDMNPLLWKSILQIIKKVRSPKVAKIYQSVWTEDGSPLLAITYRQQSLLEAKLKELYPEHTITVRIGMTYQNPSLEETTSKVLASEPDHIILLPLYPQFGSTTVLPCIDCFNRAYQHHSQRFVPPFSIVNNYCINPVYIQALVNSIHEHIQQEYNTTSTPAEFFSQTNKLFISFHGVPTRYVTELKDPYQAQCFATAKTLVKALELDEGQYQVTFQSVFGKEPWLTPQTDASLEEHAKKYPNQAGAVVICPGFSVDCIETLEENGELNRDIFIDAGGKSYSVVPCLNSRDDHIEAMIDILDDYIKLAIKHSLPAQLLMNK